MTGQYLISHETGFYLVADSKKREEEPEGWNLCCSPECHYRTIYNKARGTTAALIFLRAWPQKKCGSLILRRNVRNFQENKKNKTDKKKYCQGKNKSVEMLMNDIVDIDDQRKRFFVVKIIIFRYIIDKKDPF